jgi:nucleotide-binding universal stress UspA family protein
MKRILVCLDPSPRAAHVLERARILAAATEAKLILFRVVGLPHDAHVPPEALSMSPDALVELWRRNAERDLESLCGALPAGLVHSVVVAVGTPWSAICKAARELDVELIAIGSHGFTPMDHLLGTTAAKVVHHADRSVLMVR